MKKFFQVPTITIHDPSLRIVGVIDNNKPNSIHFFDDKWERDLAAGASVFSFSVYKKFTADSELQQDPTEVLRKRNFISFDYKGETFLFTIYKIKESRTLLELECRNLNLELINEEALPFKSDQPLTFKQYAEKMDLLNFTKLSIGINEIESYTRTLEFTSSETKLARLLSLLSKFNAEHEFKTLLNSDGTLKEFKINVYKEYDGENYGVGKKQKNIILLGERHLTDIKRTVDYNGLFTMLVPTSSQSVSEAKTNSDEHGQTVTTVKNPDGSTTRTTVWKNSDGSQSKTVINTRVIKNADGSTTTIKRTEKANGSILETTTIRTSKGNTNSTTKVLKQATSNKDTGEKELIDLGAMPDWEVKNSAGEVEFYKKGATLFAPIAAKLYPSTFTSETQSDQWIRKDISYDAKTSEELEQMAFKDLKLHAYPAVSYEIEGWTDLDIGDRVPIQDDAFSPILIIEARVSKQELSFTSPENSRTIYDNFKSLSNNLSADIQVRLAELVEEAKPYTIKISTDNGTTFKNSAGESVVKATLFKGQKQVYSDVSWRWALDGEVTVAMQYLLKGKNIENTAVLTVSGYVGDKEVATTEVTVTNLIEPTTLVVKTSNGNLFKNNLINTKLTATLWRGGKEIDKEGKEYSYIWTKTDDEGNPDEIWNQDHSYSQKTIEITQRDVFRRAQFECNVEPLG
ncbi:MAG: antireceptor [Streptococcus sp.]|uniref:antireceptor n=1 Tax=Streptococcus sp. TaxID=1306 RepID=UPI0025864E4A|nr:antireceptor [Streptococcus sp.]MCR5493020.1 antireceptor [Streptococcus sp.]